MTPFSIGAVYLWQVSNAGFGGFYEGFVGGAMMLAMIFVTDNLWRLGVMRLAAHANVVVIDVTHPTESIEWEVAHIVRKDIPVLILAQREKFVNWTNVANDHSFSKWSALLKQIRNLPLVIYPSAKQLSSRQLLDAVDFIRFERTNH